MKTWSQQLLGSPLYDIVLIFPSQTLFQREERKVKGDAEVNISDATTVTIMTFTKTALSIMTLSEMEYSIITVRIMKLS